jgi:hypothetical protein
MLVLEHVKDAGLGFASSADGDMPQNTKSNTERATQLYHSGKEKFRNKHARSLIP